MRYKSYGTHGYIHSTQAETTFQGMVVSHVSAEGMAQTRDESHRFSENDEPSCSLDQYITGPLGI